MLRISQDKKIIYNIFIHFLRTRFLLKYPLNIPTPLPPQEWLDVPDIVTIVFSLGGCRIFLKSLHVPRLLMAFKATQKSKSSLSSFLLSFWYHQCGGVSRSWSTRRLSSSQCNDRVSSEIQDLLNRNISVYAKNSLNQICNIHGHLINLSIVKLLNIL